MLAVASVVLASIASHAFHSWLKQRDRERLSATDKAELLKKFETIDAKLLELKNRDFGGRRA